MPFPNFINKYQEIPLVQAKDFWEYKRELGIYPEVDPLVGVIFTFQTKLMNFIVENYKVKKIEHVFGEFYILEDSKEKIGITGNFGVGAPIAAILIEELAAFGVKNFISVGTAGALQTDLKLGSIIVCDQAIRDEGTSYHYLPDEKYSYPSQFLTDNIIKTIKKLGLDYNMGTSWTTDAPYRETTKEIEQYKREDVLTVEMEASAVFSVAKCLNVEAAAIFTISDYISDMEWKPLFFQTGKHLQTLFQIAIETLNNI